MHESRSEIFEVTFFYSKLKKLCPKDGLNCFRSHTTEREKSKKERENEIKFVAMMMEVKEEEDS